MPSVTSKQCIDQSGILEPAENPITCNWNGIKIPIDNTPDNITIDSSGNKLSIFLIWLIAAAIFFGLCVLVAYIMVSISVWWNTPLIGAVNIGSLQWYHVFDWLYTAVLYMYMPDLWWTTTLIICAVIASISALFSLGSAMSKK